MKLFFVPFFIAFTSAQIARADSHSAALNNPLAATSMQGFLGLLVDIIQIIIVPFIVVFIIYAGFMYVTARGNSENIKQATQALIYAVIGAVIILGAEIIGGIIANTANEFNPNAPTT